MNNLEHEGLEIIAKLMAVSARTAPKSGGIDHVHIKILNIEEQNAIADMMCEIGENICNSNPNKKLGEASRTDWKSDAKTIRESGILMLIGVEGRKVLGLNCGGCGFSTCVEMLKHPQISSNEKSLPGPYCIFKVMDFSIASASAVKTAMEHNADNRMMHKAGAAALKLGILKSCNLIIGIPLSATGKNIYFDRADKLDAWKIIKPNKY
ncbi:MAG TPA: DUF2148 domain-containing protein [Victivallales bacterium]|nr:DUF2148 domain-containing protein [Victivallales bacterium]